MKLLSGVLVALSFACGSSKKDKEGEEAAKPPADATKADTAPKPPAATLLAACKPQGGPTCNFAYCGGNSALINAFPINGFRADGECNDDEIQVVPGSLNGPNCKDATLDIENGKLIGRAQPKNCEGQDLVNAKFEVRAVATNGNPKSEEITIAEVTEYSPPNATEKFPAYRMEWKNKQGNKQGLCAKEGQALRTQLGAAAMKYTGDLPKETADLITPVISELYDETGTAVAIRSDWQVQKVEWNHLACVDDALAKRVFSHLQVADAAKSRAALRMWTADYCGGNPFTVRGTLFQWVYDPKFEVEARWDEDGAKCLSAPRILRDENGDETFPKKLTQRLKDMCKLDNNGNECTKKADWLKVATHCTVNKPGKLGTSNAKQAHPIPACTGKCDPNADPAGNCATQSQIVKP